MKGFLRKFVLWFNGASIYTMVYSAVFIPIGIILGWGLVADKVFHGEPPEIFSAIIIGGCAFMSSVGGVVQIIRKESPGIMGIPFRGVLPVLTGVLWVGFSWSLIILIIYYSF